jgi:hypothetical protein
MYVFSSSVNQRQSLNVFLKLFEPWPISAVYIHLLDPRCYIIQHCTCITVFRACGYVRFSLRLKRLLENDRFGVETCRGFAKTKTTKDFP